jgi:hydrogenase assembly chaperone HypC/HupF
MCLMAPGLVLEVEPDMALVEIDGARRRAITLLLPDVAPGDWVVVAAGAVVRRIGPTQAASMRDAALVAAGKGQQTGGST